ncbi:MAG TPA: TonB-dependent receptor [Burkholderiaceae bacterium]|nr:TonB-dependent receptor [Burkholderiaceae bacterium]
MTHSSSLLPLGALSAGMGLLVSAPGFAQTAAASGAASAAEPAASAAPPDLVLKRVTVTERAERDANSVRATTTTIGKGQQALRDVPQSVTVVTEKLMDDRRVDTLKEALHQTAGVTFLAAEGGEEDIRLRGFSLAASGDIYVDSLRDPAFYERDTFSFDRVELLRGSASMLFGRGSTGGVVNQVSKQAFLANASQVEFSLGSGNYMRFTGDFNVKTSDSAALRLNLMTTNASGGGGNDKLDKQGLAATYRFGIGSDDEVYVAGYYLHNNNGINYGLPWLRRDSTQPLSASNPAGVIPGLAPNTYYGAASDYNAGGAAHATVGWTHRFAGGGELKSAIRQGRYDRDQRASTVRFFNATGENNLSDATLLTRGTNNKVQDMNTTYAQSDYSNVFEWLGRKHELLAGVDLAHEVFHNYNVAALPAGVTLDKNNPRTTIGTPDDGTGWVDESLRIKRLAGAFDAKSVGVYAQDLVQVAPHWKLLGGLRWDSFSGAYQTYQTANGGAAPVGTQLTDRGRTDKLWSKRFGVLYQPSDRASFHFSYGTSFNTSGDTYQYDDQTQNTPPEGSENYELGAKLEGFDGKLSTRLAAFYSIKTNERNRDPDSAATAALLSGRRHAAGLELDVAGRLTPAWEVFGSYAWTPVARIDVGAPGSVPGVGEGEGTRSSLTPRHSGTIWTTYQLTPALRFGGGLNARSSQTPNRNPVGIVAKRFVTADLLAEYTLNDAVAFKLNVSNLADKLYADSLYTGHYVPGPGRSVQLTMTARY